MSILSDLFFHPWQFAVIGCALAVLLPGTRVSAAPAARDLILFDFERPGGSLNLGLEFPGAKGEFRIGAESAHDGDRGGRLSFDLTSGAYVAWGLDLPVPLVEGAQTISFWARTDAVGRRVHLKTRDATGQEQIRIRADLPANEWQHLSFDVNRIDSHWSGANDGKIHWPISYVQIGVEAGATKFGYLDMDTLTVTTTATPQEQPGILRVESPHFGALFPSGEAPRFDLSTGLMDASAPRLTGSYRVYNWQDQGVGNGAVTLNPAVKGQRLVLPRLPAGAFRLDVEMHDANDPTAVVSGSARFGVLPGPNPKPCPWVGTVTHGSHGWGNGDLRYLDLMSAAGIGVVREEFGWSSIEKEKGQYATSPAMEGYVDGLARHGIRLNLLLTYGNPIYANPLDPDAYARWAGWMAEHYRGRVHDFEIWNEPANFVFMKQYGGDRSGKAPWITKFVELSQKAGAAIRAVRPDANVILCAEDGWSTLQSELEQGIGPAGNVIAIHPYCHGQPRPEREWFFDSMGRELRSLSLAHGGPNRVVITEAGWTTYDGKMKFLEIAGGYPRSSFPQQAQYLVRMYLTARAAGADYATQYDFRDDGSDPGYTEHHFGMVRQDYSPKPSLMAVAAMTRLLGQGRFVRDAAPDPAVARAYVFDVGGKAVVAAYAVEKGAKLSLPVGTGHVEVADLMGNRVPLSAPGGVAALDLSETPVYVVGANLDALAHYVTADLHDTSLSAICGDTVTTILRLENHTGRPLRPVVRCIAPPGVHAGIRWPAKGEPTVTDGGEVEASVDVRAGLGSAQPEDILVRVQDGARTIERRLTIQPAPPLSVHLDPATRGGEAWSGTALVRNESRRVLAVDAALSAEQGISAAPLKVHLAPGESAPVRYVVSRWSEGALPVSISLRTADGWNSRFSGIVYPGIIPMLPREPVIDGDLDDWPPGPRIHLDTAGQYVSGSGGAWGGPADLSAVVRLGWRPAGLCVGVEVRDNIYDQPYTDANIWQADSVQLALAPDRQQTTASVAHFEIGLARTSAGDHVYTYSSLADTTTQDANPVLFASRRGENGNLAYETLIPWALLPGIRPAEGGALRFSLVVNDSDGAGRRGWMEAFSGIGLSKDPSLYGRMVLAGGL